MAAVLEEPRQLGWDVAGPLIAEVQVKFRLPVMLVARDNAAWTKHRVVAQFDSMPYLLELAALGEIEWAVAKLTEPEMPF